ncbi:MAG TPA: 2-hydroxyacid dehydrogenase [Caulobacteraceae bacterium]
MPDPDILVLNPMPVIATAADSGLALHRFWEDREGVLGAHGARIRGVASSIGIDAALMDRLPKLEIIANFGVGYDRVDVAAAAARGIVVTNTPDVLTEEVADLTLGLLLSTLRRLPQAERYLREGKWTQRPFPLSSSLRGRKVGIVGLGRIGKAIARRLQASLVEVAYHGRQRQMDVALAYYPTVQALAEAMDVLILAAPGGAETNRMVDAGVLAALGPDGVLINIGRGSLVDEAALAAALADGTILAAGLDVFENEPNVPAVLIERDNAVLLPHLGSASVQTRNAMGQLVLDNLVSWFKGDGPITPVPETPFPR